MIPNLLVPRSGRRQRLSAPLLALGLLLVSPVAPQPSRPADAAPRPTGTVAGWYPAERMCEMDAADVALGLPWSCLRSADRSGWELRIGTSAR